MGDDRVFHSLLITLLDGSFVNGRRKKLPSSVKFAGVIREINYKMNGADQYLRKYLELYKRQHRQVRGKGISGFLTFRIRPVCYVFKWGACLLHSRKK